MTFPPALALAALLALTASTFTARAQSAWLPAPGRWLVTPSFTYEAFDHFMLGQTKTATGDTVEQFSYQIAVEHSFRQDFALDLAAGYSYLPGNTWAPTAQRRGGRMDTHIGLRWRALDEFQSAHDWMPTLTLRALAIVEGTYPRNQLNSPGDSASGGGLHLLLGKRLPTLGLGLFADAGYRFRNQTVPEQWLLSAGVYKDLVAGLSLHAAARAEWSLNGVDIGGPGFAQLGFPGTKENRLGLETGLTWLDRANRSYSVTVGHVFSGRNTPLDTAVSVAVGFPF